MTTYPLNEVLLAVLVGVVCGADDWEGVEAVADGALDWLRGFLPFAEGIPTAQTFRKVFRLIDKQVLAQSFAAWAASARQGERQGEREVVAIALRRAQGQDLARIEDGEGRNRRAASGFGLRHASGPRARATRRRRQIQRDHGNPRAARHARSRRRRRHAMGTQKAIAARIVDKGADYGLALKGNQSAFRDDAALYLADPAFADRGERAIEIDGGHGRVEERRCRALDAKWLAARYPEWKNLRALAEIEAVRIDKKSGRETRETRLYISSLEPDPKMILEAVRAHWGIENSLHWTLDVTFDEDRCRTRKDNSAFNLAVIRHAALNILKADPSRGSIKRK